MSQFALAILAGGKSSRLGGIDKALIKVDGIPLIQRIFNTLSDSVSEVLVISNSNITYPVEAPLVNDILKDCGPLGGIHSALLHSSHPNVFVVSVDMPFASKSIFMELKNHHFQGKAQITIPRHNGLIEPLYGFYSKSLVQKIEQILADGKGHPITELLNQSDTHYLDLPDSFQTRMSFYNVNTPDDLKALEL